jgi:hypothetical protein
MPLILRQFKALGYGYYKSTNQWSTPGTWSYNPNVVGYPYNPKKAKELLAAAGYPKGFKTKMHYFALFPVYTDEMTAIQRYLKQVGIDASDLWRPKFAVWLVSETLGWNSTHADLLNLTFLHMVSTASKQALNSQKIYVLGLCGSVRKSCCCMDFATKQVDPG